MQSLLLRKVSKMPATMISPSLTAIDAEVQDEARDIVRRIGDERAGTLSVIVGANHVELPKDLSRYLLSVLECVADGAAMGVRTLPEELTTTTAAEEIGVSRPTLMKMIKAGHIDSYKVGTHTRLKTADVLAFNAARAAAKRQALQQLLDDGDAYTDED